MVRLRLYSPAGYRSLYSNTARGNTLSGTVYGLPVWGIHIALVCFLVVYKKKKDLTTRMNTLSGMVMRFNKASNRSKGDQ